MSYIDLESILEQTITISQQAAALIKRIYDEEKNIQVTLKKDYSPVTKADSQADAFIRSALESITPDVEIISEEFPMPEYENRKGWDYLWLVDPVDGTKEFIERTGEFTVNIALIHNHEPVLGVICVPTSGDTFWWHKGLERTKFMDGDTRKIMDVDVELDVSNNLNILVSRRHNSDKEFLEWLNSINISYKVKNYGSSLKMCLLAKGDGDIYPRFGPTSEWDTAAGHALLLGMGGQIYEYSPNGSHTPLRYNAKESIRNPHFIAVRSSKILQMKLFV